MPFSLKIKSELPGSCGMCGGPQASLVFGNKRADSSVLRDKM